MKLFIDACTGEISSAIVNDFVVYGDPTKDQQQLHIYYFFTRYPSDPAPKLMLFAERGLNLTPTQTGHANE